MESSAFARCLCGLRVQQQHASPHFRLCEVELHPRLSTIEPRYLFVFEGHYAGYAVGEQQLEESTFLAPAVPGGQGGWGVVGLRGLHAPSLACLADIHDFVGLQQGQGRVPRSLWDGRRLESCTRNVPSSTVACCPCRSSGSSCPPLAEASVRRSALRLIYSSNQSHNIDNETGETPSLAWPSIDSFFLRNSPFFPYIVFAF